MWWDGKESSGKKDDEPADDDKGGDDSGNPFSSEKPLDIYDDIFGDLPENFLFEGFGGDLKDVGIGDMFTDVTMDALFDAVYEQEREDLAESSAGASKEEEPENIILKNISTDPYIDYLYAHKYVDALGQEVTSLGKVIES
ncbi:hypothetical protein E3N88_29214 [Mikania micrantha]|uniref:Uncharacterized protein n=1 Tax=Mikania micrantha TaxID=192012 RepID=A0A5N6MI55_9ASTR|nr:hypothetical protein E3N88_29214 [Mikania micrantha]